MLLELPELCQNPPPWRVLRLESSSGGHVSIEIIRCLCSHGEQVVQILAMAVREAGMRDGFRRAVRCAAAVLALALPAVPAFAQQLESQTLLLVARPQLRDPMFAESVVLVTRHGRSRPMGVILNKPSTFRLGAAEPGREAGREGHAVFVGGPVMPQTLVFGFRGDERSLGRRDLLNLGDGYFMGMGPGVGDSLLGAGAPAALKVFAGLSSWGQGQLEAEISRGDWLLLPFDPATVMQLDTGKLWQELLARASERRT
jgi:putative transcriptional regulator